MKYKIESKVFIYHFVVVSDSEKILISARKLSYFSLTKIPHTFKSRKLIHIWCNLRCSLTLVSSEYRMRKNKFHYIHKLFVILFVTLEHRFISVINYKLFTDCFPKVLVLTFWQICLEISFVCNFETKDM